MNKSDLIKEAIYLLSSIIEIPSFSQEENRVCEFLCDYIKAKGFTPQKIGNNLLFNRKEIQNVPTILLNSHIDTVKPVSTWTKDPLKANIVNDKIYGLGSNDAGASLVTLLLTTLNLPVSQKYNLVFCASAEEEISGKNGITQVLNLYENKFDLAIVGEPTSMQPAVAEKGLMVLDVFSAGKAGHAAREEGINAIYEALDDILWFKNYSFKKVSPFLGLVKMSVTQINAGTQHNVIPDSCSFVVDIRGNGCYTNNEILNIISDNIKSKAIPRSTRLNSSQIESSHPIYKRLLEQGYKPFGSPTLSDQALMPFPSIKMGPGNSSRSHTADEYICIQEIEDALDKYYNLLNGLEL